MHVLKGFRLGEQLRPNTMGLFNVYLDHVEGRAASIRVFSRFLGLKLQHRLIRQHTNHGNLFTDRMARHILV
jgi:hypothetical protein